MSEPVTRSGPTGRPELASLGSGQDWARWLEQAHPAQPFGIRSRASGQLFIRGSSGPTGVTCLGPTLIV